MKKARRITIPEIETAYKETRFKPSYGIFCFEGEACALTALYAQRGMNTDTIDAPAISKTLELPLAYTRGFIVGWDGESEKAKPCKPVKQWHLGVQDGIAAREAIHPVNGNP